jgi:predicted histidine transporter YuiF (NhaC family)
MDSRRLRRVASEVLQASCILVGKEKKHAWTIDVRISILDVSRETRAKRSLKSLLFIYLVAVPLCVVFAISQKEVPVKIALAGLIVPVLMIGVLWKLVVRPSINTGAGPTE